MRLGDCREIFVPFFLDVRHHEDIYSRVLYQPLLKIHYLEVRCRTKGLYGRLMLPRYGSLCNLRKQFIFGEAHWGLRGGGESTSHS